MLYRKSGLTRKKSKGFTLAELLLTLTIIGVVASLTIPDFVTNVQNADLKARSKKTFASLAEATAYLSINGNGVINLSTGDGTGNTARDSYGTVLNYLKTGTADQLKEPLSYYYKSSKFDNDFCWEGNTHCPSAILSDGALITFWEEWDQNCNAWGTPNLCGEIAIDVNGPYNGPNMEGYDVFFADLYRNSGTYQIKVVGGPGALAGCVAGSTDWTTSEGCGYNILLDNLP